MDKRYKSSKGQVVGSLTDTKVYKKRVHLSRHLLKIMDAWGIDSEIVKMIQKEGCKEIETIDVENNVVYRISFDDFMAKQVERDFGAGKQMFVSRKFWTTKAETEKRPKPFLARNPWSSPEDQLPLPF